LFSPACGHCFDKDSILSLLGSKPSISCPQKGCTKLCTRASLQDSEELLAHVQTYKRMLAQQEEEEAAAAAAKEGRGGAAAAAKKRKVVESEEEEE
jgi:SUMO ligase MMS21 Smc5/6 complex component